MYVCVCNAVTEQAIHQAVDEGAHTLEALQMRTGCAISCGCCAFMVEEVLRKALAHQVRPLTVTKSTRQITLAVSR